MPRSITVKLAILVLPALIGCGSSYEYIAPISNVYIPPDLEEYDIVSYRTLTRADFQAEEPSTLYRSQKNKIVAQTVIVIRCTPVLIDAVEIPSNPDSARWEATIEGLRFEARMIPRASWWNPKKKKEKDVRRILEHEQVHFAISELQIRRENTQLDATVRRIRATAPTQEDAATRAGKRLMKETDRVNGSVTAWNAKYDLETKNGTDEEAQKKWVERMERQMAASDSTEAAREAW